METTAAEPASVRTDDHDRRRPGSASASIPAWLSALALWFVAFVPRVLSAGQASSDEPRWLGRSEHYFDAFRALDLTSITTSTTGRGTMPGITTAAVGATARGLWGLADRLGWIEISDPFTSSLPALTLAQGLMAAANALLVVLLWWVLRSWVSPIAATIATLLLATEPFLVIHGARLTTDSFVMLFGAIGCFALAAALGVPERHRHDRRTLTLMSVISGFGLAGAFASKLSALTLAPFVGGVIVLAATRARTRGDRRDLARTLLLGAATGFALIVVIWPALWSDPSGQLTVMRGTATQAGIERPQFFFGEMTTHPGVFFYPVVGAFRMTPWFLVGGILAVVASLRNPNTRAFALLTLAFMVVPAITITSATLKYERYTLPLWPGIALLIGIGGELAFRWIADRAPKRRSLLVGGAGAIGVAIVVASLLVVPEGGVYANPLLGGGPAAVEVMGIGGPSSGHVGDLIRDREGDSCDERRVLVFQSASRLRFPCGELVQSASALRPGDYVVLDQSWKRKAEPASVRSYRSLGPRVLDVTVRGVHLADVIQVR